MSNWTENKKSLTANPAYDPSLHNFHKGVIDNAPNEGYPSNYFFADSIRALVIGFGNFFNNVFVIRYDEKGEPIKKIQVPIKYGPRMKSHDFRVEQESGKKYYIQLPNMTYRIDGYQFAGDRYAGAGEVRGFYSNYFEVNGIDYIMANKFWADVQPVPYNVTITMEAKTEHVSDLNQIVEQILVRFAPESYIDLKEFWFMNKRRSIKVRMDSISQEITSDFGEEDKRESTASFTFTLEAFFYKPIQDTAIIDQIITHCGVRNSDEIYEQKMIGNYSVNNPFTDRYDFSLQFGTKVARASAMTDFSESFMNGNYGKSYYYEELEDVVNYPIGSKQILTYSALADVNSNAWNTIDQQLKALGPQATVEWNTNSVNTKANFWSVSGNSATFNPDTKTLDTTIVTDSAKSAYSARDTIWEFSYDPSYVVDKDTKGTVISRGGLVVKQYKNLFGFGDWDSDCSHSTGIKNIVLSDDYISAAPYVTSSKVTNSDQVL